MQANECAISADTHLVMHLYRKQAMQLLYPLSPPPPPKKKYLDSLTCYSACCTEDRGWPQVTLRSLLPVLGRIFGLLRPKNTANLRKLLHFWNLVFYGIWLYQHQQDKPLMHISMPQSQRSFHKGKGLKVWPFLPVLGIQLKFCSRFKQQHLFLFWPFQYSDAEIPARW
jgi:hypothetical protein